MRRFATLSPSGLILNTILPPSNFPLNFANGTGLIKPIEFVGATVLVGVPERVEVKAAVGREVLVGIGVTVNVEVGKLVSVAVWVIVGVKVGIGVGDGMKFGRIWLHPIRKIVRESGKIF
ncbi:hypothetical protein ACFLUA_04330 [Chloroflexota bacterium]